MAASSASSVLYHVNPDEGAKPCGVTVGRCPYGADSPHFTTEKEANDEFKRQMENQHDPFATVKRSVSANNDKSIFGLPGSLSRLDHRLSELEYEEIYDFAGGSPENNKEVRKLVEARKENILKIEKTLENVNPLSRRDSAISAGTFMRFLEESRRYSRETTILDRACTASELKLGKVSAA